jgi:hypothetical protein
MNYKTFKQNFEANSDGATFHLNGNLAKNKTGFYCSITNNKFKGLSFRAFQKVFNQATAIKSRKAYIGYWCDKNTGLYYIDVTFRFLKIETATATARAFNQLAIFDIANLSEVRI